MGLALTLLSGVAWPVVNAVAIGLLVWVRHGLALVSPDGAAIKRAAPERIMGTFHTTCAETTQFGADS